MEVIPGRARVFVGIVAVVAALLCLPPTRTSWLAVGLLALVHAVGERTVKGTFHPVLLAAAFLLPPPAAA
ncbi:HD-GYP domain-containing protein, partial [Streptomyces sp. S6]